MQHNHFYFLQEILDLNYSDVPNAYTKVQKYLNGDFDLNAEENGIAHQFHYPGNGLDCGLINYYKTGYVYCNYHGWETHSNNFRTQLTFTILGHICHLLQDMCSPSHAHVAEHWYVDCLEHFASHYALPDYKNAGNFIDPFGTWYGDDQIRGLFYTANQLADLYPSNCVGTPDDCGCCGYNHDGDNAFINGQTPYALIVYYYTFFPYTHYQNPNWAQQKDKLTAYAINATASLLYWFAEEAGLGKVYTPTITNITSNMIGDNKYGYQLYRGQTGILYPLTQGTNLLYKWHLYLCENPSEESWPDNIHGIQFNTSQSSPLFSLFNENFDGALCSSYLSGLPTTLNYQLRLRLYNSSQYTVFSDRMRIKPLLIEIPGGCPFLFVLGNDTSGGSYFLENNILHRSEFSENSGNIIKDYYKLITTPKIDSGKLSIQIIETENDINYFDKVKLIAIDHPVGTGIGITESNNIVMYYSDNVSSTDNAIKNTPNNIITELIQYGQSYPKVSGTSDYIFAHFDSLSQKKNCRSFKSNLSRSGRLVTNDSLALFGQLGSDPNSIYPVAKDWAGDVTIYTNSDTYTKQFSKRINMSNVIIPFSNIEETVDHIDINYSSDYEMNYFAITPISYDGFSITEMPLLEAVQALQGDVYSLLSGLDNNIVVMDTTAVISLKFGYVLPEDSSLVRDYIFEVDGRYSVNNSERISQMHPVSNNILSSHLKYNYTLYENYPNPFNPITKIKYEIEKPGFTKLEVFDILGRHVTTLVSEFKNPGRYIVEFDASKLASGVYFYKLESNDFINIKKMILIK